MKKTKLWKKILIIILALCVIFAIAAFFIIRSFFVQPSIKGAKGSDEAVVQTVKGSIRGSIEDGVYQYLGVPYARATERFVPAEDTESWEGTLDATECGPISPQSAMLGMSSGNQEGTDINCQNLNIWTPVNNDGKKRAVMVWLHGADFLPARQMQRNITAKI